MIRIVESTLIEEAVARLCKCANVYLPKDFYGALKDAYATETSSLSKNALAQLLENLALASKNKRPMCQDTGIVVIFVTIGQDVHVNGDIAAAINAGIESAYRENFFRKSIVKDPLFERKNTGTNTPAVIHYEIVPGDVFKIDVAMKGAGSENMSALAMLKPADGPAGIVNFVVESVKKAGGNPCPPIRIGIGVGGDLEKCAILAKKALFQPLKTKRILEQNADEESHLALEILDKANRLNIGTSGLGGINTVLGVNILTAPTHIASLPVAVNINCNASRHASAVISEKCVEYDFEELCTDIEAVEFDETSCKKVAASDVQALRDAKAGECMLLSGTIFTARDAAHKKMMALLDEGEELPFDVKDKIIYYTGPCPPKEGEIIGPAGPTTAGRMDKYTLRLLEMGLLATIGKGSRSDEVKGFMKKNSGMYFVAVGGAASLLSSRMVSSSVIAFEELGPEAVYQLEVKDFPVILAIDSTGTSVI